MINTTQFILDNIQQAIENGIYISGMSWFERIFNFIDEHFFKWELHIMMAQKKCSFILRKMERHPYQYPVVLLKYKKFYILSIEKKYYKLAKANVYFFVELVQYFIIDFIMALENRLNTSIHFIHQGKFHLCLLRSLFSISSANYHIAITYNNTNQSFMPVLMENWNLSCYIDSLLTVVLLGDFEIWRAAVFRTKEYSFLDPIIGFVNPLNAIITDTEEKAREYANAVKKQLKKEYEILLGVTKTQGTYQCRTFRKLISFALPGMLDSAGNYISYDTSNIYETITKLFTNARIRLAVSTYGENTISYRECDYILMNEFMLTDEIKENGYENIDWQKTEFPFLVFSGTPGIRFHHYAQNTPFGEMGVEDPSTGNISSVSIVPVKRWFGEYILNDRYRLIGAICHKGSAFSGHFVAYLRPFFDIGMWYYYDDIKTKHGKPTFQPMQPFCPPQIFIDDGNMRPDMFFYTRVR